MKSVFISLILASLLAGSSSTFAFALMSPPKEEPYQPAEMPERLNLTSRQLAVIKRDIDRNLHNPYQPGGNDVALFDIGGTTIDGWLTTTVSPLRQPPENLPYYRFVYHDGYLVASYRHDETGVHLSSRILYNFQKAPVLSVNYASDGSILWYGHLTYDMKGLIKRVVHMHGDFRPWFAYCFSNSPRGERQEEWDYKLNGGGVWNGHQKQAPAAENRGLDKFGIRPVYPPVRFIEPVTGKTTEPSD